MCQNNEKDRLIDEAAERLAEILMSFLTAQVAENQGRSNKKQNE